MYTQDKNNEDESRIEGIIEGILFAYGKPIRKEQIIKVLNIDKEKLFEIIEVMNTKYKRANRGIIIREIDVGYQLCTKQEYYSYLKQIMEPERKHYLSQPAYETLAIIACNKPITRARIEQIRGVNCDSLVTKLLEYDLIKEAGRMDTPGRPILYATTEKFLRSFGFSSYDEVALNLDVTV